MYLTDNFINLLTVFLFHILKRYGTVTETRLVIHYVNLLFICLVIFLLLGSCRYNLLLFFFFSKIVDTVFLVLYKTADVVLHS